MNKHKVSVFISGSYTAEILADDEEEAKSIMTTKILGLEGNKDFVADGNLSLDYPHPEIEENDE